MVKYQAENWFSNVYSMSCVSIIGYTSVVKYSDCLLVQGGYELLAIP